MATMIGCPSCGKSIPKESAFCPHCGARVQDAPVTTPKARNTGALVLLGIAAVVVVVGMAFSGSNPANGGNPLLGVSAAKGNAGLMLTFREAGGVSDCMVRLLDEGDAEWTASLPGPFVQSESVRVNWSQFKDNGQVMPSHIGVNRDNVIVSCVVGDDERRSAGLSF